MVILQLTYDSMNASISVPFNVLYISRHTLDKDPAVSGAYILLELFMFSEGDGSKN